jgi:putative PIN family toxin of toxin-antitoxin system
VKVVADSNIYISGFLFPGQPASLLEQAIEGEIDLFISQEILDEVIGVMQRPRFRRTAAQVAEAQELIEQMTRRVRPTIKLDVVKDDPTDNKILECAVEAGADVGSGSCESAYPLAKELLLLCVSPVRDERRGARVRQLLNE